MPITSACHAAREKTSTENTGEAQYMYDRLKWLCAIIRVIGRSAISRAQIIGSAVSTLVDAAAAC